MLPKEYARNLIRGRGRRITGFEASFIKQFPKTGGNQVRSGRWVHAYDPNTQKAEQEG